MKKISLALVAIIVLAASACDNSTQAAGNSANASAVGLIFERGEKIDSPNFTGTAYLHNLITADSLNQNSVGSVTFEPGARTSWHSHPGSGRAYSKSVTAETE